MGFKDFLNNRLIELTKRIFDHDIQIREVDRLMSFTRRTAAINKKKIECLTRVTDRQYEKIKYLCSVIEQLRYELYHQNMEEANTLYFNSESSSESSGSDQSESETEEA